VSVSSSLGGHLLFSSSLSSNCRRRDRHDKFRPLCLDLIIYIYIYIYYIYWMSKIAGMFIDIMADRTCQWWLTDASLSQYRYQPLQRVRRTCPSLVPKRTAVQSETDLPASYFGH
jgi:hypothetical protein